MIGRFTKSGTNNSAFLMFFCQVHTLTLNRQTGQCCPVKCISFSPEQEQSHNGHLN
jgi:hypothetical protein